MKSAICRLKSQLIVAALIEKLLFKNCPRKTTARSVKSEEIGKNRQKFAQIYSIFLNKNSKYLSIKMKDSKTKLSGLKKLLTQDRPEMKLLSGYRKTAFVTIFLLYQLILFC